MISLSLFLMLAGGAEVPVAFRGVGDDGLSARFYAEVERALTGDDRIRPASAGEDARFALYSESNVVPLDGANDAFSYRIILREGASAEGVALARFEGNCSGPVSQCADHLAARVAKSVVSLSSTHR
ncbi:hypothetical protein [Sphingopyxis sp. R3-92]|uniref:hypothetical protein n=1 Tax=Sphingopyxis sp. R3-92 TaxID=3158553 RepID=UPI003EE6789E